MRTHTFARAVTAFATLGIVLNSSCAPANRHTTVKGNKNPIDSHLVKSVQKSDGTCGANSIPASQDAKSLQSEIENLLSQGTPMTADQLPAGVYTLTSVVGNIQAHNVQVPNNPLSGLNSGLTEFDLLKKSEIKLKTSTSDISEDCSRIAMGGQAPSLDLGRSAAIDTSFQIDSQHHVKGVISATYNLRSNNIGLAPGQTPAATPAVAMNANMSAAQRNQALQARQNRGLPANFSLIHQMMKSKNVDANGNYTGLLDATNGGQFDASSTATVSIRKLSETIYQVAINFSEVIKDSPNASASRQIILTYAVALSSPTSASPQASASAAPQAPVATKAPTGEAAAQGAASQSVNAPTKADAATPTATNSVAPAPTAAAPSDANQQPAQSQQDQDAAAAAGTGAAKDQPQQDAVPFVAPNIDPASQTQGI